MITYVRRARVFSQEPVVAEPVDAVLIESSRGVGRVQETGRREEVGNR